MPFQTQDVRSEGRLAFSPVLVLLVLISLTATAAAQKIDPRCSTMKDKLGCTCAVQNGGKVYYKPGDRKPSWASVVGKGTNTGGATNQAFTQCLIRHGRK
jgi:hypothetical protein